MGHMFHNSGMCNQQGKRGTQWLRLVVPMYQENIMMVQLSLRVGHNYQPELLLDVQNPEGSSGLENMGLYQKKMGFPVYSKHLNNMFVVQWHL